MALRNMRSMPTGYVSRSHGGRNFETIMFFVDKILSSVEFSLLLSVDSHDLTHTVIIDDDRLVIEESNSLHPALIPSRNDRH